MIIFNAIIAMIVIGVFLLITAASMANCCDSSEEKAHASVVLFIAIVLIFSGLLIFAGGFLRDYAVEYDQEQTQRTLKEGQQWLLNMIAGCYCA